MNASSPQPPKHRTLKAETGVISSPVVGEAPAQDISSKDLSPNSVASPNPEPKEAASEKRTSVRRTTEDSAAVASESSILSSFEAVSAPASMKVAFKVARAWHQVPDNVSDDEALARGIITPDMLLLILTVVQEVMQCLSNSTSVAFRRVRNYVDSPRETDRIMDTVRLNWMMDRAMFHLGVPRERGDLTTIRAAFIQQVQGLKEEDFQAVQTEMLFLTV